MTTDDEKEDKQFRLNESCIMQWDGKETIFRTIRWQFMVLPACSRVWASLAHKDVKELVASVNKRVVARLTLLSSSYNLHQPFNYLVKQIAKSPRKIFVPGFNPQTNYKQSLKGINVALSKRKQLRSSGKDRSASINGTWKAAKHARRWPQRKTFELNVRRQINRSAREHLWNFYEPR